MGGKGGEERRRSRCARHPWNKKCGRRKHEREQR